MIAAELQRGLLSFRGHGALAVRLANIVLILWIAYALAKLTWFLVPAPELATTPLATFQLARKLESTERSRYRQVASWHLFGHAKTTTSKLPRSQVAPETRLNLRLKGVLSSSEKGRAQAIIADPRGVQDNYPVGSRLLGDAELAEIYPDRVILLRNGRRETLRLEQLAGKSSVSAGNLTRYVPPSSTKPARALNRSTAKLLKSYQQTLKSNPGKLMESLNPVAVKKNGKLVGFRLSGGKYRQLLRGVGLSSTDVITRVNGVPLNDPAKVLEAIKSMRSTKNFAVSVLRGTQEETVSFQLP